MKERQPFASPIIQEISDVPTKSPNLRALVERELELYRERKGTKGT